MSTPTTAAGTLAPSPDTAGVGLTPPGGVENASDDDIIIPDGSNDVSLFTDDESDHSDSISKDIAAAMSGDDEGEESDEDEDFDKFIKATTSTRTQVERDATQGKRAGNPGRFHDEELEMLESGLDAYTKVPKGWKGPNAGLSAFWRSFITKFFKKFPWTRIRDVLGVGYENATKDVVWKAAVKVS